jgi:hypothetical protein
MLSISLELNSVRQAYDESNNVFIYFAREVTDRICGKFASLFAETDTARAIRELKQRDPKFSIESFNKTAREYIIPEILDAFLTADLTALRIWCSEATFNVLKANFESQLRPGVVFSGKVLDLRNLELVTAKVLDDRPVLVFSFNTQQISVVKDARGVIIDGDEVIIFREERFFLSNPCMYFRIPLIVSHMSWLWHAKSHHRIILTRADGNW